MKLHVPFYVKAIVKSFVELLHTNFWETFAKYGAHDPSKPSTSLALLRFFLILFTQKFGVGHRVALVIRNARKFKYWLIWRNFFPKNCKIFVKLTEKLWDCKRNAKQCIWTFFIDFHVIFSHLVNSMPYHLYSFCETHLKKSVHIFSSN